MTTAKNENGMMVVRGWVCEIGVPTPMAIIVYRGERGRGGVFLGQGMANINHENGVTSACNTTGVGHRFEVKIPVDAKLVANAPLNAFGVSSTLPGVIYKLKKFQPVNVPGGF